MWLHVREHFLGFQRNISLNTADHADALGKVTRIGRCLHAAYYPGEFVSGNLLLVGSYGKNTGIRPTSDVDLMYILPASEYFRYSAYATNGQSALLADLRMILKETFWSTDIRADGQVVVVDYESLKFEVVPAFNINGQIYIPDTNEGGRWKPADPIGEMVVLHQSDMQTQGHVRALVKYIKVWKRQHGILLKSIVLEEAARLFVHQWPALGHSFETPIYGPVWWHDWLVRDFFAFLLKYDRLTWKYGEIIPFGNGWRQKAEIAYREACLACYYEEHDQPLMAESHWQNIFGSQFPRTTAITSSPVRRSDLLGV